MAYKLLGFAVWKGAKWYVGRKYPRARPIALGTLVAVGVAVIAANQARRGE